MVFSKKGPFSRLQLWQLKGIHSFKNFGWSFSVSHAESHVLGRNFLGGKTKNIGNHRNLYLTADVDHRSTYLPTWQPPKVYIPVVESCLTSNHHLKQICYFFRRKNTYKKFHRLKPQFNLSPQEIYEYEAPPKKRCSCKAGDLRIPPAFFIFTSFSILHHPSQPSQPLPNKMSQVFWHPSPKKTRYQQCQGKGQRWATRHGGSFFGEEITVHHGWHEWRGCEPKMSRMLVDVTRVMGI